MKKLLILCLSILSFVAADAYEYKRQITVAQDGTGDCKTLAEAMEYIRAYMDYPCTVNIRNGVYREKVIVPSWLENVEFVGENRDSTIIVWGDHANMPWPGLGKFEKMGTFRTFTVRVDGSDITFRNLTIQNDAPRAGQAVALHTEGDRLAFYNCNILGNQDTIFTGGLNTRLFFEDCYIDGTTDFIFGPATAVFRDCMIVSKVNSYVTAASTPKGVRVGYVFDGCTLRPTETAEKVYLGRPWRPYAHTAFINCDLGGHIAPAGWHNWGKADNEQTARYEEYGNRGEGASTEARAPWARQLTAAEAAALTDLDFVFTTHDKWHPASSRELKIKN